MFTRYRLALFVSSLAVGGALLACPHPDTVYDEFVERSPVAVQVDASNECPMEVEPADINGHFLLGLNDTTFGDFVFRFAVDVVFTPVADGGMVTWTLTPLNKTNGQPVPDVDPIVVGPAVVSGPCAAFKLMKTTLEIPAAASVSSDATLSNVVLSGQIRSADLVCGTVTGQVSSPAGVPDLESGEGTSFALTRIAVGAPIPSMSAVVVRCPEATSADAGL
jgi:hypothetical protein